jgi:DNA-binding Lrp family transcriptional regulator
MVTKAILLVEVASGKVAEVCHHLRNLQTVQSAYRVTPPYDVIAVIEEESSKDVDDRVSFLKQHVDGIIRVVVCFAVDSMPAQLSTFVDRQAAEPAVRPFSTFVR